MGRAALGMDFACLKTPRANRGRAVASLSDQNLADLVLARGEIDERVRYRPRVPTR